MWVETGGNLLADLFVKSAITFLLAFNICLSKKEPSHVPTTAQLATGFSLTCLLGFVRNNNYFRCTSGWSGPVLVLMKANI